MFFPQVKAHFPGGIEQSPPHLPRAYVINIGSVNRNFRTISRGVYGKRTSAANSLLSIQIRARGKAEQAFRSSPGQILPSSLRMVKKSAASMESAPGGNYSGGIY